MSSYEQPRFYVKTMVIVHYALLCLMGKICDFLDFIGIKTGNVLEELPRTRDFAQLYEKFAIFYLKFMYRRVKFCFERPICSVAGSESVVMSRISRDFWWTSELTGETTRVVNMGSYNYLGFGDANASCNNAVHHTIERYGVATSSCRSEVGQLQVHSELEALVAEYVGVECAITFGQGFATNSLSIPALVGPGCCVISDALNHSSIILGIRLSGAETHVFEHNDMASLEKCLEKAVVSGQQGNGNPFKKILIVVEGIYSMEGSILKLDKVIELKKKYKAYLYVDEAHSIGVLGKHGRGITEYYNVDPKEVDVMMGTFSKSFSGSGGYIAGSHELIDLLRTYSRAVGYAVSMPPPPAQQIISSMSIIMGKDNSNEGQMRVRSLADNTHYFRKRLHEMGFIITGHRDSHIVPLMLYSPMLLGVFSSMALKRGLGIVAVGYPATPLLECRIRFCLSAAHTPEMLERVLNAIDEIGDELQIKFSRRKPPAWCKDVPNLISYSHQKLNVKPPANI